MTESIDNYLKAIYELEEAAAPVATTALAGRLAIASPSATAMIQRLSAHKPPLVKYTRHRGVTLTERGRRRALEVIRHHRLIETFLHRVLKFDWDEVHEEAERLEHYISERLEDRIAEFLGHPEYDPHGAPIPAKDGTLPRARFVALTHVAPGQSGRVVRINRGPEGMEAYIHSLGIKPGVALTLAARAPFDGPVSVAVGPRRTAHALGQNVAELVVIEPDE